METKTTNLEPDPREVNANPSNELFLTVEIGNAQIGGNVLKTSAGKVIVKGVLDKTHIGKYEDLKDKTLKLQTNILDANANTDRCVITTTFINENGKVLFRKVDSDEIPTDGLIKMIGNYLIV